MDAGEIRIGSRRIETLEPFARNVGLAFQNYALYPHLDVKGNLAFPLRAPRYKSQFGHNEIAQRVSSIATLLQIEALLDKPVATLSGGQKQRVALGRALIRKPTVLLLDEPITHLDARLRYEMRFELKLLQRRVGTTTIHVTHDQLEALALADLIVIMRNGVVEQVGTPDDICARPETTFVAGFVGDPPMSLLRVELGREAGGPWLQLGAARLQADERLARMLDSIREQHLMIALPADDISLSHRVGFEFPGLGRRKIEANFAGGQVSSDGGVMLLRQEFVLTNVPARVAKQILVVLLKEVTDDFPAILRSSAKFKLQVISLTRHKSK